MVTPAQLQFAELWPKPLQPIVACDRIVCILDLHAGKCPCKDIPRPHNFVLALKLRELVEHYGGNPEEVPACIPLRAHESNEAVRMAMSALCIIPEMPEKFRGHDKVSSEHANLVLYRCIIEPMEANKKPGQYPPEYLKKNKRAKNP